MDTYPQRFNVIDQELKDVHDSQRHSTGLAIDNEQRLYLT